MNSIPAKEFPGDIAVGRNVTAGGNATVRGSIIIGHNLKVEGWLDAPNMKGMNKGLFSSEDDLRIAYPHPEAGWFAAVLASDTDIASLGLAREPGRAYFMIYIAKEGEWSALLPGKLYEIKADMDEISRLWDSVAMTEADLDALADRLDSQSSELIWLQTQQTTLADSINNHTREITTLKYRVDGHDSKLAEQAEGIARSATEIIRIQNSIGVAGGIAPIAGNGKIPSEYLPGTIDEIMEFDAIVPIKLGGVYINPYTTPTGEDYDVVYYEGSNRFLARCDGEYYSLWPTAASYGSEQALPGRLPYTGRIYVDRSNNKAYRWSGSRLVEISSSIALGHTAGTAFPGNEGAALQADVETAKSGAEDAIEFTKELQSRVRNIEDAVSGSNKRIEEVDGKTNELKEYVFNLDDKAFKIADSEDIEAYLPRIDEGSMTNAQLFLTEGCRTRLMDETSRMLYETNKTPHAKGMAVLGDDKKITADILPGPIVKIGRIVTLTGSFADSRNLNIEEGKPISGTLDTSELVYVKSGTTGQILLNPTPAVAISQTKLYTEWDANTSAGILSSSQLNPLRDGRIYICDNDIYLSNGKTLVKATTVADLVSEIKGDIAKLGEDMERGFYLQTRIEITPEDIEESFACFGEELVVTDSNVMRGHSPCEFKQIPTDLKFSYDRNRSGWEKIHEWFVATLNAGRHAPLLIRGAYRTVSLWPTAIAEDGIICGALLNSNQTTNVKTVIIPNSDGTYAIRFYPDILDMNILISNMDRMSVKYSISGSDNEKEPECFYETPFDLTIDSLPTQLWGLISGADSLRYTSYQGGGASPVVMARMTNRFAEEKGTQFHSDIVVGAKEKFCLAVMREGHDSQYIPVMMHWSFI